MNFSAEEIAALAAARYRALSVASMVAGSHGLENTPIAWILAGQVFRRAPLQNWQAFPTQ